MSITKKLSLCLALAFAVPGVLHAQALEPVALAPITHNPASLTVVGNGAEQVYTPAELEQMQTYRMITDTPWRDTPAAFDGVLLSDVLAANGIADGTDIRVTAENDFQITLPADVWSTVPILVATRVDDKPHTRRARGPIQFVLPYGQTKTLGSIGEGYWVWMAARIEPAS